MPRLLLALAAAVALAAACATDSPSGPRETALTPDIDTLPVGARIRLVLTALDRGSAPATGYTVQWTTSVPTVLGIVADTADASGDVVGPASGVARDAARMDVADALAPRVTIVALTPGTATVRATVGGLEARAQIVVVPASIAPLRLLPDSTVLPIGDEIAFAAQAHGGSAPTGAIAWSSSDTTVATVSAMGRVQAHGSGVATITALAGDDAASAVVRVRGPLADVATPSPLDFATYDGSREVAHPDVVFFPDGWHGKRYWTAITPYPNGNPLVENPSLFAGNDGEGFDVPAGVVNPIERTARGHLSDPDLVYDPALGELRMYYREAVYTTKHDAVVFGPENHQRDEIWLTRSGDGVHWSPAALVLSAGDGFFVSPSVVRGGLDRSWRMWGVDAGIIGCTSQKAAVTVRESRDGIRWSDATPVALTQPSYVPWHLDVTWVAARREYWALVAAYPKGASCSGTDLFLATSPDGRTWTTYPTPVLARGAVPQFTDLVYRSTLDVTGDVITMWISGGQATMEDLKVLRMRWSASVARTTTSALLARVGRPSVVLGARGLLPFADRIRLDAAMP